MRAEVYQAPIQSYSSIRQEALIATLICLFCIVCTSCRSTAGSVEAGVTEAYRGFVPARTAVLPCREWPNAARFSSLPLSIDDPSVTEGLCEGLNQFVLEGYQDQPFMRGYSPRAINQLLGIAEKEGHLEAFDQHWSRSGNICSKCPDVATYYSQAISERQGWRVWLHELSRATRNTDAVLIPFVVYASEKEHDDRGLLIALRQAQIALLLIDTNSGALIWSGHRIGEVSNQNLVTSTAGKPSFPAWSELYQRIFVDDIWRDFPGRQYY